VKIVSDKELNLQETSFTMMKLFVQDILSKNGVTNENRMNLSDEQKSHLKKVVMDLQTQVDEFVKGKDKEVEPAEKVEAPLNLTLREMIKKRKKS
jgi:spore coat protein W